MKCPVVKWILKIPFYRRANFTGNHTDRSHFWGPVHSKIEEFRHSNRRFIKGCIILYIVRIFSSSELVEPHIIPLKVRLAVALKEEAKWQVFVRDCEHWILLLYRILILYWAYTCNSVIKSRKPIKGFVYLFFEGKPSGDFRVMILLIKTRDNSRRVRKNSRKELRRCCSPMGHNNTNHFLCPIRSQHSLDRLEMVRWESVPRGSSAHAWKLSSRLLTRPD